MPEMLYSAYHEILYRPLFNGLIFIYSLLPFPDLGLAIISLTVLVRILLFPATAKMFKSQAAMRSLGPKIKEIQEKYKEKKDEQARRLMELYAQEKVNPFSGCLPILVQLPLLIALYNVFWRGLSPLDVSALYSVVAVPEFFSATMFGIVSLTEKNYIIGFLAGASQFLQARLVPQPESLTLRSAKPHEPDLSKILSLQMKYFFPVLITIWSFSLPAALPLYWTIMNLLAIVEQIWLRKKFKEPGIKNQVQNG
ncbi:MAG: membrane protein insertase YidC [Candidatus Sungbacteria bacterium]|nr:membrane protein insertase YidC [Candidatus Sungbacteria bacterium]